MWAGAVAVQHGSHAHDRLRSHRRRAGVHALGPRSGGGRPCCACCGGAARGSGRLPVFDEPRPRPLRRGRTGRARSRCARSAAPSSRAGRRCSTARSARRPAARTRWQRVWVAEQRGQPLPPISVARVGRRLRRARRPPPRLGRAGPRRADDRRDARRRLRSAARRQAAGASWSPAEPVARRKRIRRSTTASSGSGTALVEQRAAGAVGDEPGELGHRARVEARRALDLLGDGEQLAADGRDARRAAAARRRCAGRSAAGDARAAHRATRAALRGGRPAARARAGELGHLGEVVAHAPTRRGATCARHLGARAQDDRRRDADPAAAADEQARRPRGRAT